MNLLWGGENNLKTAYVGQIPRLKDLSGQAAVRVSRGRKRGRGNFV